MGFVENISILKYFIINWFTVRNEVFLENGNGISIKGYTNNTIIFNKSFFIRNDCFEISNSLIKNVISDELIDNIKIVQPDNYLKNFNKNTLNILLYNQNKSNFNIFKQYIKWIKMKIPIIIVKKTDMQLLFYDIEVKKYGKYIKFRSEQNDSLFDKLIILMLIIALCIIIFYINYRFIFIFEFKDPLLSKFILPSCNILKYNEIQKKEQMSSCVICFEDFKEADVVRKLKCKHFFHISCVDKWLIAHSKKCPCCRIDIEIIEKDSSDELNV